MPSVLRHRPFRLLWLSQIVSQVGDRLTMVVLALAVTDLSGSASAVGFVLAARYAPLIVLIPFGGVWADRLPRRTVLAVADLTRFALHATLAVLFATGVVEVWHVIVIEALFAGAEAFAAPAYQGLIPQTVPEEEIQGATALSAVGRNVAMFVGPAIGTAVFAFAGAGAAFGVDAASFAIAVALLLFVHPRERGEPVARSGVLRELRDGFAEVRSRTWLWVTVLTANLLLLLADGPFTVLGPTRGEEAFGGSEAFGVIVAVFGVGTLGGALIGSRIRPQRPMLAAYAAILALPLAYLAYGLGLPFPLVVAAAVLGGIGASLFDVLWFTALANEIPPEALSRVSSFDYMGSYASLPIAYVLAGPAGDAFGAKEVLVTGGVCSAVLLLSAMLVPGVRALRAREPVAAQP